MAVWAFPLLTMELSPHSLTTTLSLWHSEFDWFSWRKANEHHSVLYLQRYYIVLSRKIFRREPAITRFDELFTSTHNSSQSIARLTGSDLPPYLYRVHPDHG